MFWFGLILGGVIGSVAMYIVKDYDERMEKE